jgi:hypothetical protein
MYWNTKTILQNSSGRKKISTGKGKNMGDVDCWGFESEPSLLDRKEELREEMCFLDTFHSKMETLEDTGLSNIENIQKEEQTRMMSSFKSLLKYICHFYMKYIVKNRR